MGMVNPVIGVVKSEYSLERKHPVTGLLRPHLGIDIAAKSGTEIRAAFAGVVEKVRTDSFEGDQTRGVLRGRTGNGLIVRNPDGERQVYNHPSKILVTEGQQVAAGQVIAEVGATGVVTGPHLHFEIHNKHGRTRNPRVDFKFFGILPGVG